MATFVFLLMEVVEKVEEVAKEVEQLGEIAHFRTQLALICPSTLWVYAACVHNQLLLAILIFGLGIYIYICTYLFEKKIMSLVLKYGSDKYIGN